MEASVYREMASLQKKHWWYCGRREILQELMSNLLPKGSQSILEIGCGPGGNLEMLGQFGDVKAVEMDDEARQHASSLSAIPIHPGHLPDNIPTELADGHDLICLFDVLEHVEHEEAALARIYEMLPPGGNLLLTVPAYQWLFGPHDKLNHHHRRYTEAQLTQKLIQAGFDVKRTSYFNFWLFPLAVLARLSDILFSRKTSSGSGLPASRLNNLLKTIFSSEKSWIVRHNFPFGVSIYALAAKPKT